MIKGFAITPPVLGRISIGKVVEREGKRLPEKDDQFTISTQVQIRGGIWLQHPMDETLRKAQGDKIRSIPVRVMFDDPDLNFRAAYTAFDRRTGRQVCSGDGQTCQRLTPQGLETLPCPTPQVCTFGANGACKPYGRLNVTLGDDDATGSFVFRTTGYNSIRTISARLRYLSALSGGKLSCLPLELRLRGKSTVSSFGAPIYYVDVTLRSGLTTEEALNQAASLHAQRQSAGFDQAALDDAARRGFANGFFTDTDEDATAVLEEFYPAPDGQQTTAPRTPKTHRTLKEKLNAKAVGLNGGAGNGPLASGGPS
ncbi:phage capsid protein [Rhodoferax sp. GW822-FHT02A01]|uniref:recombination directionality factor n=1 Tax=Rhodoferax sp. GW822-FHT02A01 TaxID=3141537 RepID=UPI00315DAFBF